MARPRQNLAYAEGHITVFDLAAAVCAGICRNHPFVDGNKRGGAFMALGVTSGMNGYFLDVSERDATQTTLALVAGTLGEAVLRDWGARNAFSE